MAALSTARKEYLASTFGSRVTFESTERKLYSHDVGDMPKLIKPLVGDTTPEAVVQPQVEQEIIDLVNWARENEIALTPRGMATSGYGGVLPIKKGIVVDFFRYKNVISIDPEKLNATVRPGIIWEDLDRELAKKELTLALYPTSYPSSTVGGWLAQGGAGIGSYESGWFRENVISAKIILPDGRVKEFEGDDLDYISDTEGITGIISSVTIKVQPLEDLGVIAVAVEETIGVQNLAEAVIEADLPLWSFIFINPQMADYKNISPLREHLGHTVEERVELPSTFVATLTYRIKDESTINEKLDSILKSVKGVKLDDHIAQHEWENRFKVMQVKRLGPSLVPAEIVLPLETVSAAMDEMKSKIVQPVVKEGIIVRDKKGGKPQVVILGFIPSDQRKFNYHFIFSLSLSITKIAEKHGGRAYATGLYFTGKGNSIFGKERIAKLLKFKREVDPKQLMNPGKVLGKKIISRAIAIAELLEPLTRIFGNRSKTTIGVFDPKNLKGIPVDVAWHAYSCSQCGYCVNSCDQFFGRGWESQSPRGKFFWLREFMEGREKWGQKTVDTFMVCTTCERCNTRCPEAIPVESSWMKLRGKLIHEEKRLTIPPFEMMDAALNDEGNIWAGYRTKRTDWFPEDLKEKHGPGKKGKAVYFAGCTASYVENDIAIATTRLLDDAGIDYVHVGNDENCCGTPMLVAGKWDTFADVMKKNIQLVKDAGADTVISSCPACDMMWRHGYKEWSAKLGLEYGITAKHYSEVVSEKIESGEFKFPEGDGTTEKITWHDSCHAGRVSGIY
ncbi:MAG: FAD-binding oxidoreductase, partial [Spirochaetales bacterium]|nr:FAD-binding oxidoreductase [Spirochaetales bacterium]